MKKKQLSLVIKENNILSSSIKVIEGFLFIYFLFNDHNTTRVQIEISFHCKTYKAVQVLWIES